MRIIMAAATYSPVIASRREKNYGDSGFQSSWMHIRSIIPHAPRKRSTQNIDMVV
jgi:hypothetical protein